MQVQSASEIEALRNFLDDCGGEHIGIIAKIETLGGLRQFDEILGAVSVLSLCANVQKHWYHCLN